MDRTNLYNGGVLQKDVNDALEFVFGKEEPKALETFLSCLDEERISLLKAVSQKQREHAQAIADCNYYRASFRVSLVVGLFLGVLGSIAGFFLGKDIAAWLLSCYSPELIHSSYGCLAGLALFNVYDAVRWPIHFYSLLRLKRDAVADILGEEMTPLPNEQFVPEAYSEALQEETDEEELPHSEEQA